MQKLKRVEKIPNYDDPNKQIEQLLKDIWGMTWSIIKFVASMVLWTIKNGSWAFKEAIPKRRER